MTSEKTVKFGDICQEVKTTTRDPIGDGYEHYIGLEHLDSGSLKIKRWGNIAEDNPSFTRTFRKGHLLIGKRRPYLKKAAIADFDGVCSSDIIVLQPKNSIRSVEHLSLIVQSNRFWEWAIKTSSGSLSPRTKFSHLKEFVINPLPSNAVNTAIKIQKAFWSTNDLRESTKESAYKIIKALTLEISKGNKNLGFFREGIVGDFLTLQRGFDITKKNAADGDFEVWSSSGFSYMHDTAMVEGPAVITGRKGKLGDVYFVDKPCWPHDTTLYVKDFKGNSPKYVYWFLKSLNLEKYDAATAVPTLNRNNVHKIKCRFPDIETQLAIVERLDAIQSVIQSLAECSEAASKTERSVLESFVN